jgi:hypothetical protein
LISGIYLIMATATDQNYLREKSLADTIGMVLASSTKTDSDDVPDYNEAFPQLTSTGQFDLNRSNTFFFHIIIQWNRCQGEYHNIIILFFDKKR